MGDTRDSEESLNLIDSHRTSPGEDLVVPLGPLVTFPFPSKVPSLIHPQTVSGANECLLPLKSVECVSLDT